MAEVKEKTPSEVATERLSIAIKAIDKELGKGYSVKNPQLVEFLINNMTIEADRNERIYSMC